MSSHTLSRVPQPAGSLTLADVFAAVRVAELPDRRRQEMIAALNTVSRVLGRELDQMPAEPRLLRRRLAEANPLAHKITRRRWNNVRSLLRAALTLVVTVSVSRSSVPLTPPWQALRDRLGQGNLDQRRHGELTRLMRFCSERGIDPEQVGQATFEQFRGFLAEGLRKHPEAAYTDICRLWNKMSGTVADWPAFRVVRPSRPQRWTLPWSAFPPSLEADVQVWLDRLAGTDPLADLPIRAARPQTLRTRGYQLRAAAAALVLRGREPASITGLADLVELGSFKDILRYLLDRHGDKDGTGRAGSIAQLLQAIARHHVETPPATLKEMAAIVRRLTPPRRGMNPRNRARLRPFDDPANAQALLHLPARLIVEAQRGGSLRKAALLAQVAVAIELLLVAPLRISNLAGLDIEQNVTRTHGNRRVSLAIEGHQVKNGDPLDYLLPEESVTLLDQYLRSYWPLLAAPDSTALFPGHGGRPKSAALLGSQIARAVRCYTGLTVHAHLFRHIGAKFYLDANPGGYEVVRRMLGHRSMDTTTGFYTGFETAAAARHFDATILQLRRNGAPA